MIGLIDRSVIDRLVIDRPVIVDSKSIIIKVNNSKLQMM